MENKEDSKKMNESENKNIKERDGSELAFDPKQNTHLVQPECIDVGTQENKSHNCNNTNTKIGPLHEPTPVLVVKGEEISNIPDTQNPSEIKVAGNKRGNNNESVKNNLITQIHNKNGGSKSGEKLSLVFNSQDKGGKSVCGEDNSNILMSLREGVTDLTKGAEIKRNTEKEDKLPDKHLGSILSTRGEDASIKVMEGCKSCSHIYKGSSMQPKSNSQTQTTSHVNRTTATDTDSSTHRTCSSQTAVMGQRNNSAQTACVQATQECQASPVYITASCQTSLPKSDNIRRITIKPWSARKYNDMCMCAELGAPCTCANRNASSLKMLLPRNSSWWPTVKKTLLIIAAIIPWVFLVVYAIYYYRINGNY